MSAFQRQESHPRNFTFPLASPAPASSAAAAGPGGGWGKGARPGRGRGATPTNRTDLVRDPQAARSGCPFSADSGSGRLAGFEHGVHPAAARAGSCWQGSCVRRSAPVKERAGRLQFPAAAGGAALPPRGRVLLTHLHTSRPPRSTQHAWCGLPISSAYYPPTSSAYRT